MFEKILFPTDFSDVSGKVLPHLKGMKRCGTSTVVLLHVLDEKSLDQVFRPHDVHPPGDIGPELEERFREMLQREAGKKLGDVREQLEKAGLNVKERLEWGAAAAKILEVEEVEKVHAVILGSHGKSNLEEFFLGSVSENVIRHSRAPVIVIKR